MGTETPTLFYEYNHYDSEGVVKSDLQESDSNLVTEKLAPKKKLKPLMKNLSEISPPKMHYLGTSYGLTKELFGFWSKSGYKPVYIRQSANDLTGEHSCIMIRNLENMVIDSNITIAENWLDVYSSDFSRRFVS